jgi:hypothetical protein
MAILRREVIVTTVRYEETDDLTDEQIVLWKSKDWESQEEVMEQVEFDLVHDKVLEDSNYPELIEE